MNGAAYYSGTALIDKRFVQLKNVSQFQTNENYLHELTTHGIRVIAALTVQFLDRKKDEYNHLKEEILRLENELGINSQKRLNDNKSSI